MKVIVHNENRERTTELLTEQIFYILRRHIDEYAKEKDLSEKEQATVYQYLIDHLDKQEKEN